MLNMSKLNYPRAGYCFALLLSLILVGSQLKGSYRKENGEENLTLELTPPNKELLVFILPLIGLSLGVEVDKARLREIARRLLASEGGKDDAAPSEEEQE